MAVTSQWFPLQLGPNSPASLHHRYQGCRSALGPSGFQLWCRGRAKSAPFGSSAWLVSALGPAPGVPSTESRPVSRWRLPLASLHAFGMISVLNHNINCKTDRTQLGDEDLHMSSAQIAAVGPPVMAVIAHCCPFHSAIVWTRPVCPPHPDPCCNVCFFLTHPALRGILSRGRVIQNGGPDHWFFARGRQIHVFSCPAVLMLFFACSSYQCTGRGVSV